MRIRTASAVFAATMLVAAVPLTASADFTLGANVGSARANEGDFQGDGNTGWKVHVGSSFHEYIGGEIGYVNFGEFGSNGDREAAAWAPALTLGFPIGMTRLYAKGGVAFADIEGRGADEEYKNEDPFYGVGISLGLARHLGLVAEYERYAFGPSDIDMAQVGLEFAFGRGRE
jgi:hypothetical protein